MKHAARRNPPRIWPLSRSRQRAGVSFDGQQVWFATGDRLNALDPESGEIAGRARRRRACRDGVRRQAPVPDRRGRDPEDRSEDRRGARHDPGARQWRRIRGSPGPKERSGSASIAAAGSIRSIRKPGEVLRTIESDRFVTGVTWVDGELWHGTWQDEQSDVRRIDPETGEVLERLEMPAGIGVSGLESDGGDRFFCGGGSSGKVRAIRRPRGGDAL